MSRFPGHLFLILVILASALAAQDQQTPLRVGPGVTAPRVIHKVTPHFPAEAKRQNIQGTVVVGLIIDEHGIPQDVEVLSPVGYGLDESATEAVERWKFQPGQKDGKPVRVRVTVEVNFHLSGVAFDLDTEKHRTSYNLALQQLRREANNQRSIDSMLKLAEEKFPPALYVVGVWEIGGEHVPKDDAAGRDKIREAAAKNYGPAIYRLAQELLRTSPDSAAWDEMRRAAKFGSPEAQLQLGDHFENGEGAERDPDRAKTYFRLCAVKGLAACQYRLAKLVFDAPRRRDDEYEQALAWFQLAANQGVREAEQILEQERTKLSPAQEKSIAALVRQLEALVNR